MIKPEHPEAFRNFLETQSKMMWEQCIPYHSVDNVIFAYPDKTLSVLLLRFNGVSEWMLPGGYIFKNESIDDAVYRVLKERTGVDELYLYQYATFGAVDRNIGSFFDEYDDTLFHKQRVISTCYYALVDYTKVELVKDELSAECTWIPVNRLPPMGMDHGQMIEKAMEVLREQLSHKPIGYNLLPEEFTMTELKNLYEAILGNSLNRGNFYRKIVNMHILTKLPKTRGGNAHKAQDLYSFDKERYEEKLKDSSW